MGIGQKMACSPRELQSGLEKNMFAGRKAVEVQQHRNFLIPIIKASVTPFLTQCCGCCGWNKA